MKRMTGITVLAIMMIVSVGVLPAFATPPEVVTRQAEGTYAVAECDGFDVLLDYSDEVTERFLSDQDGNLQLATYHLASRDRIYNSVTGYEVGSTFVLNDRYDPDNELFYGQGVFNNITVPGYGLVRVHVGHFVTADYTTFILEVGNGTHADQHDELLCEAMDRAP